MNAVVEFAFAEWESVRVEEIRTQPETDVRTGTISAAIRPLSLFHASSSFAGRGWPASLFTTIDVGSPEKVS